MSVEESAAGEWCYEHGEEMRDHACDAGTTGRPMTVLAEEELHSVHDVVEATRWACERLGINTVVADGDPDLPLISMPGGTFYRDQILTEAGDAEVVRILETLHRGGGTPDHPGI